MDDKYHQNSYTPQSNNSFALHYLNKTIVLIIAHDPFDIQPGHFLVVYAKFFHNYLLKHKLLKKQKDNLFPLHFQLDENKFFEPHEDFVIFLEDTSEHYHHTDSFVQKRHYLFV